ncbi:hypothetical protein CFP56_010144, partial [Quercus suber]
TKTQSKYSNHENNLSHKPNEIRTIKAKRRERSIWAAWWWRGGQAAVVAEQIDDEALTGVKDLRGSFIVVLHAPVLYLSEWTSITWAIGLAVAAPILGSISFSLDHGDQQILIAAAATATGAIFCLPAGFFKTVWIFLPYITGIVAALSVATACHTRHLGLMLRRFTSPTHQQQQRRIPIRTAVNQVRHVSSRERKKRRKPMTPVTSKIKKTKMKSFKSRFRVMNDGNIRRWKEGKRHNAHLKNLWDFCRLTRFDCKPGPQKPYNQSVKTTSECLSKKSKRRLRQPGIVPAAYAKVMKKLNFCG